MLLGLVVLCVPAIGIPADWKFWILTISGVILVVLGYSLRRSMYFRTIDRGNGERGTDSFVEHVGSRPSVVTEDPV